MNANAIRTNNGKRLIAAVAVLAMLACCLAFIVPAEETEGAVLTPSADYEYKTGTQVISEVADLTALADTETKIIFVGADGLEIQLKNDITGSANVSFVLNGDLTISSADGQKYKLSIETTYRVTDGEPGSSSLIYFNADGKTFTVDGVDLSLDNKSTGFTTKAIFNNQYAAVGGIDATVRITNGATVTIEQSGTVSTGGTGTTWLGPGSGKHSYLVINQNSTLTLNGTAAFQDTVMDIDNATIELNDVAVGLVVAGGSDIKGLNYTVNGSSGQGLDFKGKVSVTESEFEIKNAGSATKPAVMLYTSADVTMVDSSITASVTEVGTTKNTGIKVVNGWHAGIDSDGNTGIPAISGGTINADLMESAVYDGGLQTDLAQTSVSLSGVTMGSEENKSSVAKSVTVLIPSSDKTTTLYIENSGAVDIYGPVAGEITNKDQSTGTVTIAPGIETGEGVLPEDVATEYNLLANIDKGITSGTGSVSGTWTYDKTNNILYLTGFNGEGYFYDADLTKVVLSGNNIITMNTDVVNDHGYIYFAAIKNSADATLTIESATGADASLEIDIEKITSVQTETKNVGGIFSNNKIIISSDVTIENNAGLSSIKTFDVMAGQANDGTYSDVEVNGALVGDIVGFNVTANGATITGDITANTTLNLTDTTVTSGTVNATTSINMTGSEFAATSVKEAKITTGTLTMDVASIDETYALTVETITIEGNAYVPAAQKGDGSSPTTTVTGGTVIFVNYTGDKPTNGTVIVTGEFDYSTEDAKQIIVYNGVSQQVAVGQIYLADGAKIVDNTNVVTVDAQNPVSGNIATTVDKANEYIDSGEDVAILSTAPVDISGLHNEAVTVTVGTAYGTLGTEDDYFIGTIVSNNLGCETGALTINGVTFGTNRVEATPGTGVTGTGMSVTGGQDIEGDSIVTVVGSKISGKMTGNGVYIELKGVNAGTEGFTVKAGSVIINGTISFNGEDAGIVSDCPLVEGKDGLVLVNAEITGKGTIDVNDLRIIGDVTIGENVTILVDSGAEFIIDDGAVLGGDGTVKVEGTGVLINNGTIEDTVTVLVQESITVDSMEKFITALEYYNTIYISGGTVTNPAEWSSADKNVVIDVSKKTIWIGVPGNDNTDGVPAYLMVGENVTLNLIESTVNAVVGSTLAFDEKATFGINDSDVYMNVEMNEKATLNLENNVTDITGASTRLDSVGFGKVINFSNNYNLSSDTNLNVWGTINVNEGYTLTIASGNNSITIEESGQMTIDGTLVVNGKITVKNNGDLDSNLQINGVMDMNGTMDGKIDNYGTVDIDGKSDNSTIAMYDGAVLNATSVNGLLSVIGFSDVRDPVNTAAGKETHYTIGAVTLQNVKGVSITASETYTAASGSGTSYKNAQAVVTLDVSGSAKANTQAVTEQSPAEIGFTGMAIKMVSGVISNLADPKTMPVTVVNTLDVDNGIALAIDDSADAFVLAGTLNIAVGATIGCGTDVFVDGELSVSAASVRALDSAITGKENINAAYTTKTTDAVGTTPAYVTRTYTTLANAIEDAPAADDPVVFISGTVEVAEGTTVTVPAGVTVSNRDGAGTIDVKGTLVFDNFMESYIPVTGNGIEADVRIDADPARTYTTLANAIDMGVTDIVLNGDVEITSDLTIPAGVTVSSDEFGITVKTEYDEGKERNVTLTVEGTVLLTGAVTEDDATTNGIILDGSEDYDAKLVIAGENGHVQVIDDVAGLSGVAGAHYYTTVENVTVYTVSTIMYAAADSTNVVPDNYGKYTITVKGQITVDSLEFTAPENATDENPLVIEVMDIDTDNQSSLRFSEIVLGQNVAIVSINAELTGAVVMQNDEGALVSEVDLNRAVGIAVYVHEEPETDDAPAYDCMEIARYIEFGTVTIAAGTVSVDSDYDLGVINGTFTSVGVSTKYTGNLVIAQDATLVVPKDAMIDTFNFTDDLSVCITVEGTLDVAGGTVTFDGAQVDGTVNVDTNGTVNVDYAIVNGTIAIADEEDYQRNVLNVSGILVVGSKPTQLGTAAGTGTISGAVTIDEDDGIIKAYPGSDLSGAKIDWDDVNEESEALSTVFNINGETYMTVYVNAYAEAPVYLVLAMEKFELVGLFNGLNYINTNVVDPEYNDKNTGLYKIGDWYNSESMLENQKLDAEDAVGDYATVYAYAEPATVTGTLSVGLGIQFYVDDVPVNNDVGRDYELGVGAHTVRYEIQGGYNGDKVTITFNGQTVQNGGVVTVTANDNTFTLAVSGAEYVGSGGDVVVNPPEVVVNNQSNDDMSLTDILLIVLVILIVIMAIIVALRMMRS